MVCAAAALPALGWAQAAPVPQNVLSLSVSASAEVTMDLLSVTLSTTREAADAATVQSQLRQALDSALAEARRAARPGQLEVRTGDFSLYPRYAPKGGITGWQGRAEMVVEGRDTQAIAQLTGRLPTLSISRVAYGLSREARERVEADVTAQAITRFRERAAAQTQQFGFGSYALREVQVGAQEPPPYAAAPMLRMKAAGAASDESLPVEAGKATVMSTVSGSVQMLK
jgi:predicted secreted protein